MQKSQSVSFQSMGRYSLLGELNTTTQQILIVFHGQGQLAEFFIKKFNILKTKNFTIIAPEGLHQYYLKGYNGRVGAGWMTSKNRLVAIKNYLQFLDAIYVDILNKTAPTIKIHLLGFSQGAATVSRWIAQSTFSFNKLILWGGALPPDLIKDEIAARMDGKKLIHVVGNKDPYFNAAKVEKLTLLATNYGIDSELMMFEGKHDIDSSVLQSLFTID